MEREEVCRPSLWHKESQQKTREATVSSQACAKTAEGSDFKCSVHLCALHCECLCKNFTYLHSSHSSHMNFWMSHDCAQIIVWSSPKTKRSGVAHTEAGQPTQSSMLLQMNIVSILSTGITARKHLYPNLNMLNVYLNYSEFKCYVPGQVTAQRERPDTWDTWDRTMRRRLDHEGLQGSSAPTVAKRSGPMPGCETQSIDKILTKLTKSCLSIAALKCTNRIKSIIDDQQSLLHSAPQSSNVCDSKGKFWKKLEKDRRKNTSVVKRCGQQFQQVKNLILYKVVSCCNLETFDWLHVG